MTTGRIVFTGAHLLDGRNPGVSHQTVVVEGGRIVSVLEDEAFRPAPGDQVLRLEGDTLMPGMVQAHWHGSYRDLDFDPPPVGLEKPPGYLMLLAARHARMALDRGFTSVIGAGVGDALDAQLKRAIEDAVLVGPRIMPCGRWLITTGDANELPEFWWWGISERGGQRVCDGADAFRQAARREIREGAEIIKIFSDAGHALLYGSDFVTMTDEELVAVVEATHHRGKKIRSHVTAKANILRCVEVGVDVLDHVDALDRQCIDAIVEAGTFVCPSLYFIKALLETLRERGQENADFYGILQRDFDHMCEILPVASEAKVKLMVGDDWGTSMTPHGDYILELELYVNELGIDPLEVIRWATIHGAECMGAGEARGGIVEGELADLIVVKGDPAKNISVLGETRNLLAIMKDGQFIKAPAEAPELDVQSS